MGLSLSSIGLGTYLGDEDAATDAGYEACIAAGLGAGINVFDSAINYRGQKSERAIGRALGEGVRVAAPRGATRSSSRPRAATSRTTPTIRGPPRRYVQESFLDSGLAPTDEIAQECHCIAPAYLRDQIARSLREPGPGDHRSLLPPQRRDAARRRRSPRRSGSACGGRSRPSRKRPPRAGSPRGASRPGTACACRRSIRTTSRSPRCSSWPERSAAPGTTSAPSSCRPTSRWRRASSTARRRSEQARQPALPAARALGLAAFGSASILQGRLAAVELPEEIAEAFPGLRTSGQQALQFARSAPGMTTALVGVSSPEHAAEDFALAKMRSAVARADPWPLRLTACRPWACGGPRRLVFLLDRFSCSFVVECARSRPDLESARRVFGSPCPKIP